MATLVKRDNTYEDCDEEQRAKAGRAMADAAQLARWVSDNKYKGQDYQQTNAFKHHFEGSDFTVVKTMFANAAQNSDPTNAEFKFIVTCQNSQACDGGSFAVTDARPRDDEFTPRMRLCRKFFDPNTPQTKNDLNSKSDKKNPSRRDNSWCQPNQPFSFFETAGHTLLHEMTHLDELAASAGLSSRPADRRDPNQGESHGTEDVYELRDENYKYNSIPNRAARELKKYWTNKKNGQDPIIQRVENAESYAASATEFYFQTMCEWDEIQD